MDIQRTRREGLRQVIDTKFGGRQADFVAKTNMNQGEVSLLLKNKSFGEKKARKIEQLVGLPPGYLDIPRADHNTEPAPLYSGAVPLISWVKAGDWCEASDPYPIHEAEQWLPVPSRCGPRTFALRVRGESMHNPHGKPSYEDGDIIFVDPDLEAKHRDRVIIRTDGKEATFKQLIIEGERRVLKALNPAWPGGIIELHDDATICGVVIGKWVGD